MIRLRPTGASGWLLLHGGIFLRRDGKCNRWRRTSSLLQRCSTLLETSVQAEVENVVCDGDRSWGQVDETHVGCPGQRKTPFAGLLRSPLTDSNRRPPPYHRSLEREARARAGRRDHERPGRTGNRLKRSDRGWTRLPAFVFPQCSLGGCSSIRALVSGVRSGDCGDGISLVKNKLPGPLRWPV